MTSSPRIVPTRQGARILHAGHVVSEIVGRAGPTHSLFDLMAACADALARGPRLLLLGFGGGSIIAPLRGLGWNTPVDAIDLCAKSARAFRRLAGAWAGPVRVRIAEASAWLRRSRQRYDVIIEDLSIPVPGDLVMPEICFDPLPELIAGHLQPTGVLIANVFSPGRPGWGAALRSLALARHEARVVEPFDFDHRLLVCKRRMPPAHQLGRAVAGRLAALGSRQARRFRVSALRTDRTVYPQPSPGRCQRSPRARNHGGTAVLVAIPARILSS